MSNYREMVLVVEDDPQIRNFMKYALEKEEYKVLNAANAGTAMNILLSEPVDVMILDLGLPDMDGMEILAKVREWSDMPIIIVSARDQDREKVCALDAGADDYLIKPFSANELLARIRVAIRHFYHSGQVNKEEIFQVGELKVDYARHLVYLSEKEIHLTPNEYQLLTLLARSCGKVLTTGTILSEIWGKNYGTDTQALRALMAGLRRKLKITPAKPRYIITEVGVGYRLVDE